jgi:alpha-D-ribose 1-methylphosphonate 5-triphosphate synthase subunit PhnH
MDGTSAGLTLGRGFADPVLGAQRCFRNILAALSEPGTVHVLDEDIAAPAPLSSGAAQTLLTLSDYETPIWLGAGAEAAAGYLRFHSGAPVVADAGAARFAVLRGEAGEPPLDAFDPGDERYPDKSATVIVQCASLEGGEGLTLAGPGIKGERCVAPACVRDGFWDEVAANHDRYPLGVDLILVAGRSIMGLPRSTQVTRTERRR